MNWTAHSSARASHLCLSACTHRRSVPSRNRQSSLSTTYALSLAFRKYNFAMKTTIQRDTQVMARKRYDQYCPVAHALDLVGERWALLVVRELMHGPKRYTDLAERLPGSARTSSPRGCASSRPAGSSPGASCRRPPPRPSTSSRRAERRSGPCWPRSPAGACEPGASARRSRDPSRLAREGAADDHRRVRASSADRVRRRRRAGLARRGQSSWLGCSTTQRQPSPARRATSTRSSSSVTSRPSRSTVTSLAVERLAAAVAPSPAVLPAG